jgi:hypothetical protein
MLASAAAEPNQQDLPAIEPRPGLSLPNKRTLLSVNVQYAQDDEEDEDEGENADEEVAMQADPALPS